MRIFIITLLSLGVLACGTDPTFAPNPAEDLIGQWQATEMGFSYIFSGRLSYYLLDKNIDSLQVQARLQAARAIADTFVVFERVRITEFKEDGTYTDTEGGVGRWNVESRGNYLLNLVDSRGRQIEYGIHQSNFDYFEKELNKEQFMHILRQLTTISDEMVAVIEVVFDKKYVGDYGISYAYRRRGVTP